MARPPELSKTQVPPSERQLPSSKERHTEEQWRVESSGFLLRRAFGQAGTAVIHQGKPLAEQMGRLLGRCAVEGHHRGVHSGCAGDVGAPAGGRHFAHFDVICPSGDLFFVVVCHGLRGADTERIGAPAVQTVACALHALQAKRCTKRRAKRFGQHFPAEERAKKISVHRRCTAFARSVHRISTAGIMYPYNCCEGWP